MLWVLVYVFYLVLALVASCLVGYAAIRHLGLVELALARSMRTMLHRLTLDDESQPVVERTALGARGWGAGGAGGPWWGGGPRV